MGLPGFCHCLGRAQPSDPYPGQKQNWFLDWQLSVPRGRGRKKPEVRKAVAGLKERWEDLTGVPDRHSGKSQPPLLGPL